MSAQAPGFTFPGTFEICAMGAAEAGLERRVPSLLEAAGITPEEGSLSVRASSGGNYVSVTLRFAAASRAEYETAHEVLRADPDIKWTL